jgi:hypothetical protein
MKGTGILAAASFSPHINLQSNEELAFLKGTGFSPYVTD